MTANDYTDIFAHFTHVLAAETLANHIATLGIPCDLVEVNDSAYGGNHFGIRVARRFIEQLKKALALTQVAKYADILSGQILAGRLAREGIPSYVGTYSVQHLLALGRSAVPIDDKGDLGLGAVAVPKAFVEAAERVLREPEVTDEELTELALRTKPGLDDQI